MADSLDTTGFPSISQASAKAASGAIPYPEFEGYQIVEELPRGGQAIVYRAIHRATKTTVALKVLPPGLLASEAARRGFEREVELVAALNHPNVVGIRDSGVVQGQYYFAMEYIRGMDLARYVRSQDLAFRDRVILFRKICDAVTHAHQRGVIHRDLKPSNILVDERGEPHVVDFGLAKSIGAEGSASQDATQLTFTGEIKGTLAYMSPEQASGRAQFVDVRSDVYALGVILYQMLTDRFPYDVSGSPLQTLENVKSADPVRPRQLLRRFDSDVEAIILKALAKEPDRRYQSAAELQQDIQSWLNGLPIAVRSVSSLYLLHKIINRHRYTTAVVGLLVLIVLGFSFFSFSLYKDAQRAQRESADLAACWAAEADHNLVVAERVTFTCFLQAYHAGDMDQASGISRFLTKDSLQSKAASFLLDPRPLTVKEPGFRSSLPDSKKWFADFILGEFYEQNGEHDKALEVCKRSQAEFAGFTAKGTDMDDWLGMLLKARIRKLSSPGNLGVAEKPTGERRSSETGSP